MVSDDVKNFEVFQVEGMVLKPGVFTGRDGKPTKISAEIVERVFENINGPVPLYFKHDKSLDWVVKGYASKFTFNRETKQISYVSHLFDAKTQEQVAVFSSDKVSPEIDFEGEENAYTNAWLKGISFVPNAAIDGTDVKVTPVMFSKPEEGKEMVDEKEFAEIKVKYEALLKEQEKTAKQIEKLSGENAAMKESIATLTEERDLARKEVEKYIKIETDRKKDIVKSLSGEISQFGWNPEGLLNGLDVDQQINVLTQVKTNYLKTKPPADTSTSGQSGGGTSPDVALREVMSELGLSAENIALLNGE